MHDQLFKELLEVFLADLLRIMVPDLARGLDLDRITPQRGEVFTDTPRGKRRQVDVLARVATPTRPRLVYVHVEIEARHRSSIAARMREYAMLLESRHRHPILPLVLTLRGGPRGIRKVTHRSELFGEELSLFHYWSFSLSTSRAEHFLRRSEPLAWALAALMASDWTAPRHKLECIRPIVEASDLDDAGRSLLANCVETYIQLSATEREEYREMAHLNANLDVEQSWSERLLAQGRAEGVRQGRAEGVRQGRADGMRQMVRHLIEQRFGSLPRPIEARLEGLADPEDLERLAAAVLAVDSIDALDLD